MDIPKELELWAAWICFHCWFN